MAYKPVPAAWKTTPPQWKADVDEVVTAHHASPKIARLAFRAIIEARKMKLWEFLAFKDHCRFFIDRQ